MDISIKLKNGNEVKLKTLQFPGEENIIRFIPNSGGEFLFSVILDGANYRIENLSDDVETSLADL